MKSRWRHQNTLIENNSKLHETVRHIFITDDYFRLLWCYQEVPVVDLLEDYPFTRHRFDWYIENLGVIIELHGRQHYEAINRGSMSYDESQREFKRQRERDLLKKRAALSAGFRYIEIPYNSINKLTPELLKQLILA